MVFPYGGLGYFPPVEPVVGERMLLTLAVASVMTSVGLCTRLACALTFVLFTWIFHMWCGPACAGFGGWVGGHALRPGRGGLLASESNHNNHYILFCHVSFATMFLDWGSLLSVDAVFARWWHRRRATGAPAPVTTTVPYWQLLSMQVCVCVCVCVQWV